MKRDLICFLLFRDKEDEHQCTDEQQEWVEQIGDDLEGGNAVPQLCYSGDRDQHLCAVGDDALEDTGEGVQDGSSLARC